MSVNDVQKFFPAAKAIQEQDPSRPGWVALLKADSVEADGLREAATFTFKDGRLINVVTTSGGRPNPGAITDKTSDEYSRVFKISMASRSGASRRPRETFSSLVSGA
jgi:hypothetical protein